MNIRLNQTGLKNTKGRNEVLYCLQGATTPVDVSHISSHLQQRNIDLNQATIYRILDSFYEKGIINRFEFQEGKFRYELAGKEHHHLICETCGAVEDVSDCGISSLEKEIKQKKKFLVKRHSLEFFGICQNCQK